MPQKLFPAPITAVAALCLLAACSPNAMPTGYAHHYKPYKSANPPVSETFTETQRKTMGPEQADQFRMAVYTLAESLTRRAGLPPKPVFVMKPEKPSAFYMMMDNDVRESLRHLNYNLADSPDGAYVITYGAQPKTGADGKPMVRAAGDTSPNVRITLYVYDGAGEGARLLTEESNEFYISGAELLLADVPDNAAPQARYNNSGDER